MRFAWMIAPILYYNHTLFHIQSSSFFVIGFIAAMQSTMKLIGLGMLFLDLFARLPIGISYFIYQIVCAIVTLD